MLVPKAQLSRAMADLRARGQVVPVLIGEDEDMQRMAESCALGVGAFDEIIAAARDIDVEAFFEEREKAWRHQHQYEAEAILRRAAENPGSFSDDIGKDILADYRRRMREDDFRLNERAEVLGAWPLKPRPAPDLTKEQSGWSFGAWPQLGEILRAPSPRHVVLAPIREDAQAFAYLHVGGWNDSPSPAQHVAVFRYFADRYDIELFQLDDYRMHCTVGAPPVTKEEALELAWLQFFYCPRLLDHGPRTINDLAALLLNGQSWAFWWD